MFFLVRHFPYPSADEPRTVPLTGDALAALRAALRAVHEPCVFLLDGNP